MKTHPNIVVILADDMGYGDLSCLNEESKIHTRHMDRLAEEGMTFTDAHASTSVCTPSRYGLLTGRYAWRGRLQRGVLGPMEAPLIEEDLLTLPQMLRDRGYATACIGKWHLGMTWPLPNPAEDTEQLAALSWGSARTAELSGQIDYTRPITNGPIARGFDTYFGVDVPNFPPYCFIEDDRTVGAPAGPKPDTMYGTPGAMLPGWDLEQILPTLTRKAVEYIEGRSGGDKPFFLYFPLTGPHCPIVPTAEFRGRSGAGVYGDFVMQVDDTVGQVAAAIDRCGLAEETLLIVTSDNGSPGRDGQDAKPGTVVEAYGHNPSWILRGMKADTWDGGHRIPFIARWPGRIEPGSRCEAMICLMDLMATCAAAAGADPPGGAAADSLNVLPYLLGEAPAEAIRNDIVHHAGNGLFGIRKGPWKLICGRGSGGFSRDPEVTKYDPPGQLYNLDEDIGESRNLYHDRGDIVTDLSALLNERRRRPRGG